MRGFLHLRRHAVARLEAERHEQVGIARRLGLEVGVGVLLAVLELEAHRVARAREAAGEEGVKVVAHFSETKQQKSRAKRGFSVSRRRLSCPPWRRRPSPPWPTWRSRCAPAWRTPRATRRRRWRPGLPIRPLAPETAAPSAFPGACGRALPSAFP